MLQITQSWEETWAQGLLQPVASRSQ